MLRDLAPVSVFSLQEPCSVPLGIAAENGHTKTVKRLLEAGANFNHQDKVMTTTVLIPTFSYGDYLRLLLTENLVFVELGDRPTQDRLRSHNTTSTRLTSISVAAGEPAPWWEQLRVASILLCRYIYIHSSAVYEVFSTVARRNVLCGCSKVVYVYQKSESVEKNSSLAYKDFDIQHSLNVPQGHWFYTTVHRIVLLHPELRGIGGLQQFLLWTAARAWLLSVVFQQCIIIIPCQYMSLAFRLITFSFCVCACVCV